MIDWSDANFSVHSDSFVTPFSAAVIAPVLMNSLALRLRSSVSGCQSIRCQYFKNIYLTSTTTTTTITTSTTVWFSLLIVCD